MLSIIISWGILFVFSYITGLFVLHIAYKICSNETEEIQRFGFGIDECLFAGTVIITMYAQIFSLFYRIGIIAFGSLSILVAVLFIFILIKCRYILTEHIRKSRELSLFQWCLVIITVLSMISWTNTVPGIYDTYLYHNQAIQWLERYGVIKGLGNLQCRFAYNSAFLPLQALFSFRGITGQSLHTVNGFYCLISLIYCTVSHGLVTHRALGLSDYFKLSSAIYTCFIITLISAPGTDTLALTLFLYICIKWAEGIDSSDTSPNRYAMLCMLAVFDVTLKLSVAPCVLLAVYPILIYIRQKKYRYIAFHAAAGLLISLPWIVRNVVISGYLIYPYTQIDLFNVDWKIPPSVANFDSWKIQVRSKGYEDVSMLDKHVWEWLPDVWFKKYPGWFERFCMISGIILSVMLLIYLSYIIYKRSFKPVYHLFYIMILISFFTWFFTAPTIRYGVVFSFSLIAIWLQILSGRNTVLFQRINLIFKFPIYLYAALMLVHTLGNWSELREQPLIMQKDYEHIETEAYQYPELTVWYPVNGSDLCGTNVFPSLPYRKMYELLEMRGDDISDGFRVKSEYFNKAIDINGAIY